MLRTLKEWETETGVILRNNRNCGMLTEKQFKRRIKHEYIKCVNVNMKMYKILNLKMYNFVQN